METSENGRGGGERLRGLMLSHWTGGAGTALDGQGPVDCVRGLSAT